MNQTSLKALIDRAEILVVPGVSDALGAVFAEQAGFNALFLPGAGLAYTRCAKPDLGLLGLSDVMGALAAITERVSRPVIVDADTGYGNVLNVQQTVRRLERAGAAAIQIEDQDFPKRCGHLNGKAVVQPAEMVGKVKAAVDARASEETLIVARTDAIAVEGLEPALDRARIYAEAGADVLFVEGPPDIVAMERIGRELRDHAPLLINMVEGGMTPILPAAELQALGFSVTIFPGSLARAFAFMARELLETLKRDGTTDAYRDRMMDFTALGRVVGTETYLERGKVYERWENSYDAG